jgi:ubiquitin carboxyl-terminal hydrolase 5/13
LSLVIPLDLATNHRQVQEYQQLLATGQISKDTPPVKLNIPFDALLENWATPETIGDFFSSATNSRGTAQKTVRFKSFPDYLGIHLSRYILGEDWTEKKLDVYVPVPETLNLESLRSSGLLPGEITLPEDAANNPAANPAPSAFIPDEEIVAQLLSMGFSENACKRAAVGVGNSSYDAAANWLMEHMEDPDVNDPLPSAEPQPSSGASVNVDPMALEMLVSMGIDVAHATKGLKETGGDLDRAADWCFSHEPEPDLPAGAVQPAAGESAGFSDGAGVYELFAIISHIGADTGSGHYVCHIKKNGQWAIFNDRKVRIVLFRHS